MITKNRNLKPKEKELQTKILVIARLIFLVLIFAGLIAACQPAVGEIEATSPAEPVLLKIAVLPILDALPMYVAQKESLFEKNGIKVEFIPVASGAERDQVITAGQADGMINEALSTMFYNKEKLQVQTVRYARAATAQDALFSILASAQSGFTTVDDLRNVEIGVSEGTVIDYLTDRLLEAEGFGADEIKKIAVPKIPDRMALLGTGELKAAMLPEPPVTLAEQQGAKLILDDRKHPEYSFSTITFRKPVIDKNPEAVRSFLAAIEQATDLINQDGAKYADLLVEQKVVPPPLAGKFKVPQFVKAGVPTEAQWKDVLNWAFAKGLITKDISYQESVNASFLP